MTTVGAYEAKTHLPRLLDEVEHGGTVTITKHGRPVARLVPIDRRVGPVAAVIAGLREVRSGLAISADEVRELIEEGRR